MSTSTVAAYNEQRTRNDEKQKVVEPTGAPSNDTDSLMVFLDDSEKPQNMTIARKWLIVVLISSAALCVTCASSMVSTLMFIVLRKKSTYLDHRGVFHGGRSGSRFSY